MRAPTSKTKRTTQREVNMKQKIKSYEFWMSIVSLVALIAGSIGENVPHLTEICTAIVGVLVAIGLVKKPPNASETQNAESKDDAALEKDKAE